ncbi:MAG: hypothetical protein ACTSSH_10785, partial [Candidatus Heimdallarchaeota archaeon]
MAETMKLQFLIDAEDDTKAALQSAQRGMDKLHGKVKAMGPAFQKMALAGAAALTATGIGLWEATQAAANAQETFSKFDTVFDDVGVKAEETAQNLRNSWGLAESSAKELLASTGDLLVGIGLTGDEALKLSDKTIKLGIDLASFQNYTGGAKGAVEALTKGLLGEREMLKGLGIVILESDLKLKLVENGTDKLTGTALKAARAEATLQLAMEQSQKAQGDYHRTQGSVVNRQRELAERTKELSETIGKIFIPILGKVIDKVFPVIENLAKWVEENQELTKYIIIATAAISGLIATIGIMGLVLPGVITGVTLLAKAIVIVTAKTFLLNAAFIGLPFVALAVAIGIITKKLFEFGKEVGGMGNAWSLTMLQMQQNVISFAIKAVEMFNEIGQHIPWLSTQIGGALSYLREELANSTVMFDAYTASVVEGAQATSENTEELDALEKELVALVPELTNLGSGAIDTGEKVDKVAEAFEKYTENIKDLGQKAADSIVDITDKIVDLEEKLYNLRVGYMMDTNAERMEYAEQYLDQEQRVADAQEELANAETAKERIEAQKKLKIEKETLEKYSHFQEKYYEEIAILRAEDAKSEMQRAVESIQTAGWKTLHEFKAEETRILNEIEAENNKLIEIKKIQDIALQEHDKFLALQELHSVDSINRQIA